MSRGSFRLGPLLGPDELTENDMPAQPIDDRNVVLLQPLRSPRGLKADLPLTPRATRIVARTRDAVRDVLHGRQLTSDAPAPVGARISPGARP